MIWHWKVVTLLFISQSHSRLLLKMVVEHSLLRIKGQSSVQLNTEKYGTRFHKPALLNEQLGKSLAVFI